MTEVTINDERTNARRTLSISVKTYERLGKLGHWSESADKLINRLIDEKLGKEQSLQVRSF